MPTTLNVRVVVGHGLPVARDPGESRGLLHCPLGTVAVHDCEESALVLVLIYYPVHRAVCSGGSDPGLKRVHCISSLNALSSAKVHFGNNCIYNHVLSNNCLSRKSKPIEDSCSLVRLEVADRAAPNTHSGSLLP
jgi:hypothetical protein